MRITTERREVRKEAWKKREKERLRPKNHSPDRGTRKVWGDPSSVPGGRRGGGEDSVFDTIEEIGPEKNGV
jgi:hypothetical protein